MKNVSIGPCPVCGETIWKFRFEPVKISAGTVTFNFKKVPYEQNEKGRHFWVLLSDGSRMMIAICKSCFEGLSLRMVKNILADIIYTKLKKIEKDKVMDDDKKYCLFDRVRTIELVHWAGEEKEIVGYINEKIRHNR